LRVGEYVEAHEYLERALALFQPGRDADLAFRFAHDVGVGVMFLLAIALWPLGEVERAIALVEGAHRRISSLAHIGTHAYGKMHAAVFELMRGDHVRAAANAFELARLTREHDLPMWQAFGFFLEGVATAEGRGLGEGLTDMRRGVELLREQNVLIFDSLIKIALAEAEVRAGDVDRALAVLDEAVATCERIGHRAFETELHRVRGDMLLRRDPANPATAEEALQTAIAVARQQRTRSFELRAALSLAKLYQSTGRLADAHTVLAQALDGFAPLPSPSGRRVGDEGPARRDEGSDALTPGPSPDPRVEPEEERGDALAAEMPELVEAQAVLAALAETNEVKGAAASRQRRLQLQTSYGQAMMHSRRRERAADKILSSSMAITHFPGEVGTAVARS
jgi:tetratricopeptide (TPR) repeat protein